jgi:hypothetical protein
MSPDDLFLSEQHPRSRRWAVVEDDGTTAWMYLTGPDRQKPVADCWLYNRVEAPSVFSSSRGSAPVAPATHVVDRRACEPPPRRDQVRFEWSSDGDAVAVHFGPELIGFIAATERRGFSKNLSTSGPFGSPIDRALYERLFGAPRRR